VPKAHRDRDSRKCGAKTTVTNQSSVYVNGRLWAVKGDDCDHQEGRLINTSGDTVFIEGKPVIVHGPDHAHPDETEEIDPMTAEGSDNVTAYGR